MTILERVAWMEGSRVQGLVVGVISTVIHGYGEELLFVQDTDITPPVQASESLTDTDVSDDLPKSLSSSLPSSRLRSIVQLLVELYIQKCAGSNVKAIKSIKTIGVRAGQKTTPETVELLSKVTEMLALLIKVAPPKYQLHLAAVTLNVLIGVLRDPVFQTELGPRVLLSIKSVMESLNKNTEELDPKFLELILNGSLGALLKKQSSFAPGKGISAPAEVSSESLGFNLGEVPIKSNQPAEVDKDMEVSSIEITEWCNGLLGMMLILTSCTGVRIRKTYLEQFERLVMSSIESDISKIVTVGYQCLKGVILIESASAVSDAGKIRSRLFMKELIPFVVTTIVVRAAQESSATSGTGKDDKVGMQVIEESIQTLKSLATASSETARSGIISIIMSTVVPLLQPVDAASGSSKAQAIHTLALNNLLSLGGQFPAEFRHGLLSLSTERRTRLETAIRQSVLQQQEEQQKQQERERREQERLARERDRVKIELKSSFAGFT
ncbi:hypothetical protein BGZ76_011895 [Entomortierella beljakovae]|nr:hypothetical protein BGZ76_011895 [Entomortierella beljakovae]